MIQDLNGKVALVTGASRGIGQEIARQFAKSGARVALHYNSGQAQAQKTLDELKGTGHFLVQADLADPDAVEGLVDQVVDQAGRIDILVNNAGVWEFHPIAKFAFDEWCESWQRTMDINLMAPAHLCYHAAHHMMKQGGGKIINISSRGAFRGEPDAPAYGAAKAGMNAMSQSLAQALAPFGIRVYVIAPGFVETDMASVVLDSPQGDNIRAQSPLNRVARVDEIARLALFLAGEGTGYMTGCIIDINGASYLRT
jgi:3-oxoacyl-[acyl-carrier protein] reductase